MFSLLCFDRRVEGRAPRILFFESDLSRPLQHPKSAKRPRVRFFCAQLRRGRWICVSNFSCFLQTIMETVKAFSPVSLEVKLAASRPEFAGLGSEGGILVLWMVGGRASGRGRSQHAGGRGRAHKASTYHQTRLKATRARPERGSISRGALTRCFISYPDILSCV